MKDRIKQYIEQKGIAAGELAVMLDVQRSNISHILNGRNKPGASFIEKLLLVFPDINARWLLTGVGDMLEGVAEQEIEQSDTTVPVGTIAPSSEKERDNSDVKKVAMQNDPLIENEDEVDRMVLLFRDGTFATYKKR